MKFNKDLIWDYDLTEKDLEREQVREWYVARVITKGNWNDIHDLGLDMIKKYLPKVKIPQKLREFWEWYFTQGEKLCRS